MKAIEYVKKHAIRGACKCGKCIDSIKNPEQDQPEGHSIDLTFFKVANNGATKEEFERIFRKEFPNWFDGEEHNYLQGGADIGDQGICLLAFGLGHLLGVWECQCPETMLSFLSKEIKLEMAGSGLISILTKN